MATPVKRDELTFKWHGAKELDEALRRLPEAVHKSVLQSALRKAGKILVDHVRSDGSAPRRTGMLVASVTVGTKLGNRQRKARVREGEAEVFIGPTYPFGAHGHLVEFGATRDKRGVMPANPFMRRAWDANKDRILNVFAEELAKSISRKARSLAKKGIRI